MQLEIFNFKSGEQNSFDQVRTIEEDGKVWFCATDVAKVLGYQNPQQAIRLHCKLMGVREFSTPTKNQYDTIVMQNVKFITEGNVYRLISRSKLPSAEKFETWLFDEVVPSIRFKGYYGSVDRSKLPDFVKRYTANVHLIPFNYFSVISELFIRLYASLESVGYKMPDKSVKGITMTPDISVGRCFAAYLKNNKSEFWDKRKMYKHHFSDGRVCDAAMYPIEALPEFIKYINDHWLYERADKYFRERDPEALEYLPKLLGHTKKTA